MNSAGLASARRTVELWTLSAEEFLAEANVGILPWVPLMRVSGPPESVVERCAIRIKREGEDQQVGDLLAIAEVMTGLRSPGSELLTLFQGEKAMIESPGVQRWKAETAHELALDVLKDRFGAVPRDITKPLREILNEKKLRN